jgi:putative acetyltransferase
MLMVRPETEADVDEVRHVNYLAFGRRDEADLVDTLRQVGAAVVSLVAVVDDEVVGHVLLTEVRGDGVSGLGLGPLAVAPAHQRRGVGSALVEAALGEGARRGYGWMVVLGHPAYYTRFGFERADSRGLRCEWDVPADAFMARELAPGALGGVEGLVRYRPEFASL